MPTVNAADDLNVDCHLFDDGAPNRSCGACRNASDQAEIDTLQTTVGPAFVIPCGLNPVCLEACIDAGTDLTAECGACFSTVIDVHDCQLYRAVATNPTGLAWLICVNTNGCQDCPGYAVSWPVSQSSNRRHPSKGGCRFSCLPEGPARGAPAFGGIRSRWLTAGGTNRSPFTPLWVRLQHLSNQHNYGI